MRPSLFVAAVAVLSSLMLCSTALAAPPDQGGLSAMQGIDVQTLSVEEMQAISGELNAYDIAAALTAGAARLEKYPRLHDAVLKLADYYSTNAVKINLVFQRLGILTACQTCK